MSTDNSDTGIDLGQSPPVDRRNALSLAGKLAIGAVAGSAAALVADEHAAAVDGNPVLFANNNGGSTGRAIEANGLAGKAILATATGTQPVIQATAASAGGPAIKAIGANSGLTGAIDATGQIAIKATSSQIFSTVQARNTNTTGGTTVEAISDGSVGTGVLGSSTASGPTANLSTGVRGSSARGVGVRAESSDGSDVGGRGLAAVGDRADIHIGNADADEFFRLGAPATRNHAQGHVLGELVLDGDTGDLWLCVGASNAGQLGRWQRLGGPGVAGGLVPIRPRRVYDSRFDPAGKLAGATSRTVSVADAIDILTGDVSAADIVPEGATAIAYNLTITETETLGGGGFLSVAPGTETALQASSINWSGADQNLANGLVVQLDPSRQVKVFAGPSATDRTHFVIDVTGFYV